MGTQDLGMDTHLQSLTASLWLSLAARLSFVIPYIAPGCCLVLDSSVYEGCVSSGVNMLAFWACDRRQVTCAPVRLRLVDTAMHLWAGPQGRCPPAGVWQAVVNHACKCLCAWIKEWLRGGGWQPGVVSLCCPKPLGTHPALCAPSRGLDQASCSLTTL